MKTLLVSLEGSTHEVVSTHLDLNDFETTGPVPTEHAWETLVEHSPGAMVIELASYTDPAWDFITRVRGDGRYSHVPIVILTSALDPQVLDRGEELGCQVLGKPFSVSALLDKLRLAVRKAGRPSGGHVDLRAVDVSILLDVYRIDGHIHVTPEIRRFSDAWEAIMKDERSFVPVTGARITATNKETDTLVATADLLQVRKDQIRTVSPKSEAP